MTVIGNKTKLKSERNEIFRWLSLENPHYSQLLRRLCETASPYARLIAIVLEEFENQILQPRDEKMLQLERDAELRISLVEAEIRRQNDRVTNLKKSNFQAKCEFGSGSTVLNGLNSDIKRLEKLLEEHGIDINEQEMRQTQDSGTDTKETVLDAPILDEDGYRELWTEQQELLDLLEILREKREHLKEVYREEVAKCVRRKWPRLFTKASSHDSQ
jgi:hypothetical protein